MHSASSNRSTTLRALAPERGGAGSVGELRSALSTTRFLSSGDTATVTRRRVIPPQPIRMIRGGDGLDLAGEVVKVRALHRGLCERDSQLPDAVPGKPRCKQRADGSAVGV